MSHRFLEIAGTPAVQAAQAAQGSRNAYAKFDSGPATHDRLGPAEAAFIAVRDSFYLASVSETGWPYIQHRGGPPGFLKVLDDRRLGFADYRGNRQYITLGNTAGDPRVALFLTDYPNRRRLKLLGRMRVVASDDAGLAAALVDTDYGARVERHFVIDVEAFDWNCPQHITPRFTQGELAEALDPIRRRLADLESENANLRRSLAAQQETRS